METLIILGVVGLAYLLISKPGGLLASTSGSASVAATLNRNQQLLNQQTALTLGSSAYGPSQTDQLVSRGVSTGAGVGGTALVGAAGLGGAAAGAATAGIGLVVALGLGEWAAHTARVKGAEAENKGIDNIVPAFDADLKEINAAFKAGQISASQAISYLSAVRDNYWSYMGQFAGKPGVASRPCPGGQTGGPATILAGFTSGTSGCVTGQPRCDKTCTAGCCVGCANINGAIANQIWALQTGYHGPVGVCTVFGSKFGAHDRVGYRLTW